MNRHIGIVGFLIIWSCLALVAQNRPQENPSFAEPKGVRGMRFPALSPDKVSTGYLGMTLAPSKKN